MKLSLIQPCIGRRPGRSYIKSWQMEPLSLATLAAVTPADVEVRLIDDRLEDIPFDESTDLVALTVETFTARRAYQIASDYRRRGIPVVMGGFHPTLCPEEASGFADAIVLGEAETVWPQVIEDARLGRLEAIYQGDGRVRPVGLSPDRSIFRGKRYLPIGLVESSRGCRFRCEFCAVSSFYDATFSGRPVDEVAAEMADVARHRKLIFLVDDNFAGDLDRAAELLHALEGCGLDWVTQCSINAARDEDFVHLLTRAGCRAVLIGFESLDDANLTAMNKSFNLADGGYETALANLAKHRVAVYGTFVFGYDRDSAATFAEAVDFARRHDFFIAAFNHVVPFPGTPLYHRLEAEGRLLYRRWWLDEDYRFNHLAFRPLGFEPDELRRHCLEARRRFYSLSSILQRFRGPANSRRAFSLRNFWPINLLHRAEISRRDNHPLGDPAWQGGTRPVSRPTPAARECPT